MDPAEEKVTPQVHHRKKLKDLKPGSRGKSILLPPALRVGKLSVARGP